MRNNVLFNISLSQLWGVKNMPGDKSTKLLFSMLMIFSLLFASCKEDTVQPITLGTIQGKVVDAETGIALSDASVSTNPPTEAIMSDSQGSFILKNVPVGSYSIIAAKNGYDKNTVSITVLENLSAQAVIFLSKKTTTNKAPTTPSNPSPAIGKTIDSLAVNLAWSSKDPDADQVLFDVYLYESNSSTQNLIASNYTDTTLRVVGLKYGTTYFWQVIAKDTSSTSTNGNIWSFTTKQFPNNAIVFASNVENNYSIYSTDINGSNIIKLTNDSYKNLWPRLNPRQNKIAYVSDATGDPQIYVMNNDGSNVLKITNISVSGYNNNGYGFSWSPDGGRILYAHYDKLYRVDINGSNLQIIATAPANRNFRECSWSPKGDKIVCSTVGVNPFDNEIMLMNADGSNQSVLINNPAGTVSAPVFSIDGTKILFTQDISGYEDQSGRQLNSHIFSMKITNSDTTDLSKSKIDGTNDLFPRFSPDGSKIIFTNVVNTAGSKPEIWVMDADGSNRKKLVDNGNMADWK